MYIPTRTGEHQVGHWREPKVSMRSCSADPLTTAPLGRRMEEDSLLDRIWEESLSIEGKSVKVTAFNTSPPPSQNRQKDDDCLQDPSCHFTLGALRFFLVSHDHRDPWARIRKRCQRQQWSLLRVLGTGNLPGLAIPSQHTARPSSQTDRLIGVLIPIDRYG